MASDDIGPYDDDEEPKIGNCESVDDHCRGVELYASDKFDPKVVEVNNLDYKYEEDITADDLSDTGDEFDHIFQETKINL